MEQVQPHNITLIAYGLMFLAAAVYLVFFPGLFQSNRSPAYLWTMRLIGVVSLLLGAAGLWLGLGHTIPSFTG